MPGFGGNRRAEEHQIEITIAKALDRLAEGACGFDDVSGGFPGCILSSQQRGIEANCENDDDGHKRLRCAREPRLEPGDTDCYAALSPDDMLLSRADCLDSAPLVATSPFLQWARAGACPLCRDWASRTSGA